MRTAGKFQYLVLALTGVLAVVLQPGVLGPLTQAFRPFDVSVEPRTGGDTLVVVAHVDTTSDVVVRLPVECDLPLAGPPIGRAHLSALVTGQPAPVLDVSVDTADAADLGPATAPRAACPTFVLTRARAAADSGGTHPPAQRTSRRTSAPPAARPASTRPGPQPRGQPRDVRPPGQRPDGAPQAVGADSGVATATAAAAAAARRAAALPESAYFVWHSAQAVVAHLVVPGGRPRLGGWAVYPRARRVVRRRDAQVSDAVRWLLLLGFLAAGGVTVRGLRADRDHAADAPAEEGAGAPPDRYAPFVAQVTGRDTDETARLQQVVRWRLARRDDRDIEADLVRQGIPATRAPLVIASAVSQFARVVDAEVADIRHRIGAPGRRPDDGAHATGAQPTGADHGTPAVATPQPPAPAAASSPGARGANRGGSTPATIPPADV